MPKVKSSHEGRPFVESEIIDFFSLVQNTLTAM